MEKAFAFPDATGRDDVCKWETMFCGCMPGDDEGAAAATTAAAELGECTAATATAAAAACMWWMSRGSIGDGGAVGSERSTNLSHSVSGMPASADTRTCGSKESGEGSSISLHAVYMGEIMLSWSATECNTRTWNPQTTSHHETAHLPGNDMCRFRH